MHRRLYKGSRQQKLLHPSYENPWFLQSSNKDRPLPFEIQRSVTSSMTQTSPAPSPRPSRHASQLHYHHQTNGSKSNTSTSSSGNHHHQRHECSSYYPHSHLSNSEVPQMQFCGKRRGRRSSQSSQSSCASCSQAHLLQV